MYACMAMDMGRTKLLVIIILDLDGLGLVLSPDISDPAPIVLVPVPCSSTMHYGSTMQYGST